MANSVRLKRQHTLFLIGSSTCGEAALEVIIFYRSESTFAARHARAAFAVGWDSDPELEYEKVARI